MQPSSFAGWVIARRNSPAVEVPTAAEIRAGVEAVTRELSAVLEEVVNAES